MKFYIAAYFHQKPLVQSIFSELERLGHEIAVDWTQHAGVPLAERDSKPDVVAEYAVADLQGVISSDVFVLLSEPVDGRAKYAELGAAIASNVMNGKPRIFVVGEETNQSIFYYHPSVERTKSVEAALAACRPRLPPPEQFLVKTNERDAINRDES